MELTVARITTSLRLSEQLRERLVLAAAAEGVSLTTLIERFIEEGLAVLDHPGVVFKPGPAGRRAALAGGPDIWEVASALRHTTGTDRLVWPPSPEEFGIDERQVEIALRYAAAHRDEIEACIRANDRALEEAGRVAAERMRLLRVKFSSTRCSRRKSSSICEWGWPRGDDAV